MHCRIDIEESGPQEDHEGGNEEVVDDSYSALLQNGLYCFALFSICIVIASIVAISIVATYNHVTAVKPEVYPVPFRIVDHGIWSGYRHEFFKERVTYIKAEQICSSRDSGSLLYFNSQEQEDKFDLYVSLNFWSEIDYPAFQLWTSGFVLAKQMNRTVLVKWPEPTGEELQEMRNCVNRGEWQINAFGVSKICWQERHIIKDYIEKNQPEDIDITKGSDTGCWQLVKRNDIAPESFYRFVCQRKI